MRAPLLAERVLSLRRAVEAGPSAASASGGSRVVLVGLREPSPAPLLAAADGRGWRSGQRARGRLRRGRRRAPRRRHRGPPGARSRGWRRPASPSRCSSTAGPTGSRSCGGRAPRDRRRAAPRGRRRRARQRWPADRGRNGTSVLAVDDDAITLEIISAALRAAGHAVTALSDPLEFWDALERSRPDLVALDVQMPGADGIELCRALRADPHWRGTPVLFLTATTPPARSRSCSPRAPTTTSPSRSTRPSWSRASPAAWSGWARRARARSATCATGLLRREAAEPQLNGCSRSRSGCGRRSPSRRSRSTASTRSTRSASAGWHWPAPSRATCCARATSAPCWGAGELVLGMIGSDETDVPAPARRGDRGGHGQAADRLGGRRRVPARRRGPGRARGRGVRVRAAAPRREGGNRVAVAGGRPEGSRRVDVALVEDDEVLARLVLDALPRAATATRWIARRRRGGATSSAASPRGCAPAWSCSTGTCRRATA